MKNSFSHSNQSGKRCVRFALILAVALGSCVTTELRAQVIVVPNSLATNDGNGRGTSPTGGPTSVRENFVFDASQFRSLSGPSLLTKFAWRPDTIPGESGPRTVTLQVYASTTTRSVAGLSATFAENIGADNTLVFSGTLNWATGNLPGPGNTRQFDVVFPFTTPFLYDPAAGNLLLDIRLSGNGQAITLDIVTGNEMVKKVLNTSSSNATTGTFGGPTQVTQFTFEPPPAAVPYNYLTNDGAITITGYDCASGAVTIPSTINGLLVTSIGERAFSGCTNLTNVTIPNSVTSIGHFAFYDCASLTSVTIGTSVTSIGDYAFTGCRSLTSVTIPNSVASIGYATFAGCTSLTNITIGNSVTNIGDAAFSGCTNLTSVTIPNSVTSIGGESFYYCTSLTAVYFKGNTPSLPDGEGVFTSSDNAIVYYLPGTTGWGTTFAGRPAVLWDPRARTSDASFGVRTNRFGFTITGTSGLVIVVEASTNLANSAWIPVGTNTLTGGSSYFSDPQWTNYPARFYRLRSP